MNSHVLLVHEHRPAYQSYFLAACCKLIDLLYSYCRVPTVFWRLYAIVFSLLHECRGFLLAKGLYNEKLHTIFFDYRWLF